MTTALTRFENETGEGIIAFEPWGGPENGLAWSKFYCHLTVAGERVFEFGSPCGTCGIVFRKIGLAENYVCDAEAVLLLGDLSSLPSLPILRRVSRVLQPGLYHPIIAEGTVSLVEPGNSDDYFAREVAKLAESREADPLTPYWRFGSAFDLAEREHVGGFHRALVMSVVMPLHNPSLLDPDRVRYWRQRHQDGTTLTALAVSVVDDQFSVMGPTDKMYPYDEHILYTHCLLDGHHRVQAAAELGAAVRILALVARDMSLVSDEALLTVLGGFTHEPR